MWSETFTDSYGWKWSLRRPQGWSTIQLLASPPEEQRLTLEPFSYGFQPEDLEGLARILEAARGHLEEGPGREVYAIHLWRNEEAARDKAGDGYCGSWHIPVVEEDAGRIAELRRAGFGTAVSPEDETSSVRAFFHADELAAQVEAAEESLEVVARPEVVHYRPGMGASGKLARAELAAGRDPRD